MLPFCQRYKQAPMSQRALISRGRRENYSFDGVPRMATLSIKLLRLQIIHPFCLVWHISVLQARRRAGAHSIIVLLPVLIFLLTPDRFISNTILTSFEPRIYSKQNRRELFLMIFLWASTLASISAAIEQSFSLSGVDNCPVCSTPQLNQI